MFRRLNFFLFICVFVSSCGVRNFQYSTNSGIKKNLIINGIELSESDLLSKSVVNLLYNVNNNWRGGCGGSILNSRFILTAAHCLKGITPEAMLVNFSVKSLHRERQRDPKSAVVNVEELFITRKVKAFIAHPNFRGSKDDIGVLLIEGVVPEGAIPVSLLPEEYLDLSLNKTLLEGEVYKMTIVGSGLLSEDPIIYSDVLRIAQVEVEFFGEHLIADQTKGHGSCKGDSGGPSFITIDDNTYQVGVTRGAHGLSTSCHEKGEWANPALHRVFIEESMEKLLSL